PSRCAAATACCAPSGASSSASASWRSPGRSCATSRPSRACPSGSRCSSSTSPRSCSWAWRGRARAASRPGSRSRAASWRSPGSARPDLVGVLLALGAAVGVGTYFVLSARPTRLPPVALAAAGLGVGAAGLGAAGLVGLLPLAARFDEVALLGSSVPWFVPLAVVVLVATAFAYVSGVAATVRMGERLASFVGLSEVLFAVVIAWLLLGEAPTLVQAAGGVLVVAGVVLVRLAGTPAAR